jgi:hypothetical protein
VTNRATNFNIHSTITGYALIGAPSGMSISPNGVITWTPQQTNSPSTNVVTTVVTNSNPFDLVNPSLTSTNQFTVIVKEANVAPTLPTIPTQTVNELTLLTVTNTATNANIHSTIAGYRLVSPPSGMSISASGVITWTPQQTNSPSTNTITTIVTNSNPFDLVNPSLTSTNQFTVIVKEVNVAPTLPTIPTQTVYDLTLMTVVNTAIEPNIHATLSYSLVNAPTNASINTNGVITWTPGVAQCPSTNLFTTVVTAADSFDLVHPTLSATNSFTAIVRPAINLTNASWLGNGQFQFSFNTTAGQDYTVQYSTDLIHWTSVLELEGDGDTFTIIDPNAGDPHRYYRIISP